MGKPLWFASLTVLLLGASPSGEIQDVFFLRRGDSGANVYKVFSVESSLPQIRVSYSFLSFECTRFVFVPAQ